ncbi:MAG: hypothetical protein PUA59_07835 [Clostridium sp.]|nr:hypothetical protein [Clostridium sp.]
MGEIKRSYDQAKNKERQIGILAELNDCDRSEIEKIISVESMREQHEPVKAVVEKQSEKEMGLNDVMNTLFSRLDELEKKIKPLEEEYRNIKIAIDVIAKVRSVHG